MYYNPGNWYNSFLKLNVLFIMPSDSIKNQFFIGFDRWQVEISCELAKADSWSKNLQPLCRCLLLTITSIAALALLPLIALAGLVFSAIYFARQFTVSSAERGGYHFNAAAVRQLLQQVWKGKSADVPKQPTSCSLHRRPLAVEKDQKVDFTYIAVSGLSQIVRLVNGYSGSSSTISREVLMLSLSSLSDRVNRFAIQAAGAMPYLPLVDGFDALCPMMMLTDQPSPERVLVDEAVESVEEKLKQKSDQPCDRFKVRHFSIVDETKNPVSRLRATGKLLLQGDIQRTTRLFLNIMRCEDDEDQNMNKMIQLSLTMLANFSSAILGRNGVRTDKEIALFVQMRYRYLFKVTQYLESALKAKCVTVQRTSTSFTQPSDKGEFCVNLTQIPVELKQGIRNFSLDLQELPGIGLKLIACLLSPERHAKVVKFFEALISGKKVAVETTSLWRDTQIEQKSADEILDDLLPFGTNAIMSHFIVKNVRKLFEIKEELTRAQALDEIRNRIIQVDNSRNMEQLKIDKSIHFVQKVLPHILSRMMAILEKIRALEEGQEADGLMLLIKNSREIYYEVAGLGPEEYNLEIQEAQKPPLKMRSIVRNQIHHPVVT